MTDFVMNYLHLMNHYVMYEENIKFTLKKKKNRFLIELISNIVI